MFTADPLLSQGFRKRGQATFSFYRKERIKHHGREKISTQKAFFIQYQAGDVGSLSNGFKAT
jgi:hypothetical protein